MKADPAHTIIKFLGGANKVASILGCDSTRVYRWTYPAGVNEGKDGLIPTKDMVQLLAHASMNKIDLKAQDFIDPSRLKALIAKREGVAA